MIVGVGDIGSFSRKVFKQIKKSIGMTTKLILEKLDLIKSELDYIKEHMVDADSILSEDDREALEQARKEHAEGKTKSLKQLKTELGL